MFQCDDLSFSNLALARKLGNDNRKGFERVFIKSKTYSSYGKIFFRTLPRYLIRELLKTYD